MRQTDSFSGIIVGVDFADDSVSVKSVQATADESAWLVFAESQGRTFAIAFLALVNIRTSERLGIQPKPGITSENNLELIQQTELESEENLSLCEFARKNE